MNLQSTPVSVTGYCVLRDAVYVYWTRWWAMPSSLLFAWTYSKHTHNTHPFLSSITKGAMSVHTHIHVNTHTVHVSPHIWCRYTSSCVCYPSPTLDGETEASSSMEINISISAQMTSCFPSTLVALFSWRYRRGPIYIPARFDLTKGPVSYVGKTHVGQKSNGTFE
jgi:hypothetical protein